MNFTMYNNTTDRELMQTSQRDDIRLSMVRYQVNDRLHNQIYYEITMTYGAKYIYRTYQTNIDRTWYIYDTIKTALITNF
jgi:hypothetical protein